MMTFLLCFVVEAKKVDLMVLNIDGIGPDKLKQLKSMPAIDWWIEMGGKMVVSTQMVALNNLPSGVSVETTLKDLTFENLAIHIPGHCDHSRPDALLHLYLKQVISGDMSRIVDISKVFDKSRLPLHQSVLPLDKNKVLTYQIKNRSIDLPDKSAEVQGLLDQIDKDRWYSQATFLADHNRMLEADLITTGDWLENKFEALGLSTSRVTLHNHYRGTNVLGFKQGTTRPNDWYVVGAHMDSRNSNWNDSLPSPGAEDNASGCSGVLEMANVISQYDTEASIYFMCFIEEESGLLGSQDVVTYFSNNGDIDKVKTMLNLDMISYRGPNRNDAIVGTRNNWHPTLAETVAANGDLYTDLDWQVNSFMCCTDFVSFANVGIPAVTTNQPDISTYAGYHTTQDRAVNLDPDLGAGIIKANLATLIDLVGVDFLSGDLIFADGFEKP